MMRLLPPTILVALALTFEVSAGDARLGKWSERAGREWWDERPDAVGWQAAGEELHAALLSAQETHGVDRALSNPHFMRWMVHRRWLSFFPEEFVSHQYFRHAENRQRFRQLGSMPEFLDRLSTTLVVEDDGARAAEILCRILASREEDLGEYLNLAIALAVVADTPPPEGWPHPYVEREVIPVGDLDPAERFGFLVDSHKAGKLLFDPRELSIRELCFVVDTIVEMNELAYAQQIEISSPKRLEDLYFAVKYDEGRIQRSRYQWPHGRYRLIDVGLKGGICADQAYFVSHAGKAKGVPTVVFVGQGLSGTHAWVGFLRSRGTWELSAARFRGEKYPVGVAYDPQTWNRVTDAKLADEFAVAGNGKKLRDCRRVLQWAILNKDAEFNREVMAVAKRRMPRSEDAWEMEAAWLLRNEADLRVQAKFWENWIREFDDARDLKIRGQKALLRTLEAQGDLKAAGRLRDKVVAEHRSARFDLGISMAADAVMAKVGARDWEGAQAEYVKVIKRFRRKAGGHLFYNLVQPYVNACLQDGQFGDAEKAVENLRDGFDAQAGSILDNDMQKLIRAVEGGRP